MSDYEHPSGCRGLSARSNDKASADEHPRERLLRYGAQSLADAELLSILLNAGHRRATALDLARELLEDNGGLAGLLQIYNDGQEPRAQGFGPAKSSTLRAAIEFGNRLARAQIPKRYLMKHPEGVARYLTLRYSMAKQELMGALFLDVRNGLIAESEIFRGTLSQLCVEPRAILRAALQQRASSFILFHARPSQDPSPSDDDVTFSQRLTEAGQLIGVPLVDYLILGSPGRWVSLSRRDLP